MSRHFPDFLAKYVDFTQHSEAPTMFHFWTGVSIISGVLRRRVWIEEAIFQIIPNFYIIFVGPPGIVTKSTTVNIGSRILRRVEGVRFGPNSMTWQGLTKALEEARQVVQFGDDMDTILQMSCLYISLSELGTFLKTKDDELLSILIQMWDGERTEWKHRTRTAREGDTNEIIVVNPLMTVIGCTTPAWVRRNFPLHVIEGGLTSRCIFVCSNRKRQLVSYPHKIIDMEAFERDIQLLADDLNDIAQIIGEYRLTPEAEEWGDAWYKTHNALLTKGIGDRYSGYISRKQGHVHKLAMILSAARSNDRIVQKHDLERAASIVTALEADTNKMFELVGADNSSRQTADILAQIRSCGSISYRDLWRMFMSFMDHRAFEMAVKSLTAAGHIIHTEDENKQLFLIAFNDGEGEEKRRLQK